MEEPLTRQRRENSEFVVLLFFIYLFLNSDNFEDYSFIYVRLELSVAIYYWKEKPMGEYRIPYPLRGLKYIYIPTQLISY